MTQKRRQKKRTRILKLRESATRVQATQQPMPHEASPALDDQDLEFLEVMRGLQVRRMPGAGGLPVRRQAIQRAHFASDREDEQAFQDAMSALDVRPLDGRTAQSADPLPTAFGSGLPKDDGIPPRRDVEEPAIHNGTAPAPRRRSLPDAGPRKVTPTRFATDPDDAKRMEQALREGLVTLGAKFQGAPPPAPMRRVSRHTRQPQGDPDAELDLHGATQEQAIHRVQGFLLTARNQRLRHVLIITGRGLNSGEQGPVLRDAVRHWLERNGGPYVRDFHAAPPRHGGEGALWVVMR